MRKEAESAFAQVEGRSYRFVGLEWYVLFTLATSIGITAWWTGVQFTDT